MNIKEYLRSLYAEPVPEWLAAWRVGDVTPLHDFLQSRMVFYPGAGLDGHAVATFGGSGAAHCFLYADNLVGEEALERDQKTCEEDARARKELAKAGVLNTPYGYSERERLLFNAYLENHPEHWVHEEAANSRRRYEEEDLC